MGQQVVRQFRGHGEVANGSPVVSLQFGNYLAFAVVREYDPLSGHCVLQCGASARLRGVRKARVDEQVRCFDELHDVRAQWVDNLELVLVRRKYLERGAVTEAIERIADSAAQLFIMSAHRLFHFRRPAQGERCSPANSMHRRYRSLPSRGWAPSRRTVDLGKSRCAHRRLQPGWFAGHGPGASRQMPPSLTCSCSRPIRTLWTCVYSPPTGVGQTVDAALFE